MTLMRREFITLLGGAAAAWPLASRAQQPVMPVIGFLSAVSPDGFTERQRVFRQGLNEIGYFEGENVRIEYRWAENQLDRLPELVTDLVRKEVAVIVATGGTAPALAAKAATPSIPIVFTTPEDPVKLGLVASLSRPGGNLTGVNIFVGELISKRLELMRELVPGATNVAVFINPANPQRADSHVEEVEMAGRAMGLRIRIFKVGSSRDINSAFASFVRDRPDIVFAGPDPFFVGRRVQLATLAARHALPSSFSTRDHVEAGGLMSYETKILDSYRQAGVYAGRVLKGAKPADLPVVQSTSFELIINAQTAFMLGLTISPSLLARADEVIE